MYGIRSSSTLDENRRDLTLPRLRPSLKKEWCTRSTARTRTQFKSTNLIGMNTAISARFILVIRYEKDFVLVLEAFVGFSDSKSYVGLRSHIWRTDKLRPAKQEG